MAGELGRIGPEAWDMTQRGQQYLGVGVTWAASVGLFLWLGSLLDRQVGTESVFALVGAVIGIVAGFIYLIRMVKQGSGRNTDVRDKE